MEPFWQNYIQYTNMILHIFYLKKIDKYKRTNEFIIVWMKSYLCDIPSTNEMPWNISGRFPINYSSNIMPRHSWCCMSVNKIYKTKEEFDQRITVKYGYREHAYNELTHTAKWCSLPESLLQVVNLTNIMNYVYNKVKSPTPGTSF